MDKKKKTKVQADIIKSQQEALNVISKETNLATITAIEDQVFKDSGRIIQESLGFADIEIDPDTGDVIPPKEWENLDVSEQQRRLRVAKMALMPSADVPHGLKMAHATWIGILKARAAKETGTKILNIENATFPAPAPLKDDVEIIDVDE